MTASPSAAESVEALVVGGGPAGLMAAETLRAAGRSVLVVDASPSLARKFLLAGRGGLNLTHSEPLDAFLARYGEAAERLRCAVEAFPPQALGEFSEALGEPTFVGTSGRVFPKSFKATPLLRAWLRRLEAQGVSARLRWRLSGLEPGRARFATPEGERTIQARVMVLALGGASWPRLGGNGDWAAILRDLGVGVGDLTPANGGVRVDWSPVFLERFVGAPLKAIRWRAGALETRAEAVVAAYGLEGGAIYALGPELREALQARGEASVTLDLKPDLSEAEVAAKLTGPAGASLATRLRKGLHLSPAVTGLLREAGPPPGEPQALAQRIKSCPLRLTGLAPIERAISSAGGVRWDEIDERYGLRRLPGVFVAGEMIDWEAPTGGYLLQGAFSTGRAAGQGAAVFLARPI